MNKLYRILFIVFLIGSNVSSESFAQSLDFAHYTPLKCSGVTPNDFLIPSYQKYNSEVIEINVNKGISKKERKLQKEFSFTTNYSIDEILMSGKVLYGNLVSDYINKVAGRILENDPLLKSKMRFYLLNVADANTLSTNTGIVFITTGLMAQLENEAQLAFVLSNEISHYKLNHSYQSYKTSKDILDNKKYDALGNEEKNIKFLRYSSENELLADVEGLKLFTDAGYKQSEALKLIDILLYSYLPFDEIRFPKNYFNDSFYRIPEKYFIDSAIEISADEDGDDEDRSHPNTQLRKSNLEKYIKRQAEGQLNYFPLSDFEEVLKISRYEQGYLLIIKGSYVKAFYHAFLLENTYGESQYTSELKAGALYGMNKYKLYGKESTLGNLDEYEGQISIPYRLLNGMKKDEFNILAAKQIYAVFKKYPTKYIYNLTCDVFIDMLYAHTYYKNDFLSEADYNTTLTSSEEVDADSSVDVISNGSGNSKVKKIKKKITNTSISTEIGYQKKAFIPNFNELGFNYFLDSIERKVLTLKKLEEDLPPNKLRSEPYRRYEQLIKDEQNIQNLKGKTLGIDSLIIIAPSYTSVTYSHDEDNPTPDNLGDELKEIELAKCIRGNAINQGMEVNLIDINNRSTLNSTQLNEYAVIYNWLGEKFTHADKNDFLFSQKYIDSVVYKSNFKNVCLTGFTYKYIRFGSIPKVIFSAFFPPVFPIALAFNSDSRKLNYYYVLFDLETGEQKLIAFTTLHRRPRAKIVNLQISYVLYQTQATVK